MARTQAWPTVRSNGDGPPPSTLAAQIVQNQTRPLVSQQNEQQALFGTLLNEILNDTGAEIESDIATNVQLVKVLVEAGLLVLAQDAPFSADIRTQQARDSISVIAKTIKRQPHILVAPIVENGPPLCLWLLTQLLAVIGNPKARSLALVELLSTSIEVLSKSIKLWQFASLLTSTVQECINDALSAVESTATLTTFDIKLPPARSISLLWPLPLTSITASQECYTTIRDVGQACELVAQLTRISTLPAIFRAEVHKRITLILIRNRHVFRNVGQWEDLVGYLLEFDNAFLQLTILEELSNGVLQGELSLSQSSQESIIRALIAVGHVSHSYVELSLHATLSQLKFAHEFQHLSEPLQIAINARIEQHVLNTNHTISDIPVSMENGRFASCSKHGRHSSHMSKRRRTNQTEQGGGSAVVIDSVCDFFEITLEEESLSSQLAHGYLSKNIKQQHIAWRHLDCLAAHRPDDIGSAINIILEASPMPGDAKSRTLCMQVIRHCLKRCNTDTLLDLTTSAMGSLCLRSLQSSSRDLRIAAGNSISHFVRPSMDPDLRQDNCKTILQWMRQLSVQEALGVHETLISAWGNLASVCFEDELNLILLQLIDFMGRPNSLIRGLAFAEIRSIAERKSELGNVEALLSPFWSSIATSVVEDLISKPQKCQMLCELLSKDFNDFLLQTQIHTIPFLVSTKRKDIVIRLAAARSPDSTAFDMLVQPRENLVAVLSHLLCQGGQDGEDFAMACLTAIDPQFADQEVSDLVRMDSTAIACEILKNAGLQPENHKAKAHGAFTALADLCERTPAQRRASSKTSRSVGAFFERQILGILTNFSTIIESKRAAHSDREKLSCISATAEMITLAKDKIGLALPQVRALLQSAIEQSPLCQEAWRTWLELLLALTTDDVGSIIEQTFALLLKHWESFSADLQHSTHNTIAQIVPRHRSVITSRVTSLPSLSHIPLFSKIGGEIDHLQAGEPIDGRFKSFSDRLQGKNSTVTIQALKDLTAYLQCNQTALHDVAVNEQPSQSLSDLVRTLLDLSLELGTEDPDSAELCGKALGLIGCLDPSRIEAVRKKERFIVLSNFESADEVVRWVVLLLEQYLVQAFRSVTNAQAQGFMAYVIQELLKFCGFDQETTLRPRATQSARVSQRWAEMSDPVRTTLAPFLSSKYTVTTSNSFNQAQRKYPGFTKESSHNTWLRGLVYDLTRKAEGENATILFPHLARIVRGHDLAIAEFILPYVVLNIVLAGTVQQARDIRNELLAILQAQAETREQLENVKLCSESLFAVLDYMSVWVREKRKTLAETRANAYRTGISPGDFDEVKDMGQVETVTNFLADVPTQLVAARAMDCGSYARALFNWEQFIRQSRSLIPQTSANGHTDPSYYKLHDIYSRIDEPDGLEGISSHLSILSEEQQATLHARTGRWTAAQAWYESMLVGDEDNEALQEASLQCLRETGRFSTLLKYIDGYANASGSKVTPAFLVPLQVEGAWRTDDLSALRSSLARAEDSAHKDFGVKLGQLLLDSHDQRSEQAQELLRSMRIDVVSSMTAATTNSLQSSQKDLLRLHMLAEIEMINRAKDEAKERPALHDALWNRLDLLGSQTAQAQELLAVHRILLREQKQSAGSWLTSARLARRDGNIESAYYAVLRAVEGGANAAKLEEAKLLWHDGHRRQAISALQQAIKAGIFASAEEVGTSDQPVSILGTPQNLIAAKAHLLHAKWLDLAGQTASKEMTLKYQYATKTYQKWEKGHYHLGKHYWRLLEAEKAWPKAKQNAILLHAELPRLVIENLVRSVPFGNKYWFETIPKMLTLWLDLGMDVAAAKSPRSDLELVEKRKSALHAVNKQLRKYFDRIPPYIFYSALPQMLSRISHPHADVWRELSHIISRIVGTYPSQALWSLMAVAKATDRVRQERGKEIIAKLRSGETKAKADGVADVRTLVVAGQRLSDGLLLASECSVEPRITSVSLSKDLGFNMRLAPCGLVVPIESTLAVNLAPGADGARIRAHKPFVHDKVTITAFQDQVLVLSSLQRPKKLNLRGSDGKSYGLLCKPKDDLRKDQRLMEFNGIINRALKHDPAGSKRRLYIKTYAVTPLSEESGCLEWVEGIKPIRDILLGSYTRRGIRPNYNEIRNDLNEACRMLENVHIFEEKVLSKFPPALHEWFTEVFAEPETWFAARLRYARSAAVMSIVGHILGLGDRHGENILLQESTGGVFHVDFNCLFDKGLTFDKPEVVPFRLTRNMVDAMGPYGYEGPFRKSCEVTLCLLRQNKDTLMTILETFLYDPTADFVGKKKRSSTGYPETPHDILEVVESKLRGLFRGETVPLSEEGYVDALIIDAVSHWNLCQMYIGWCAFL